MDCGPTARLGHLSYKADKGGFMPKVNGKKYAYTAKGKAAAAKARAKKKRK